MLIDICRDITQRIQALERIQAEARRLNDYTTRRERLEEARDTLTDASTSTAILRRAHIPTPAAPTGLKAIVSFAKRVESALADNPEQVLTADFEFASLGRQASAVSTELQGPLLAAWRDWVASHKPSLSDELLDLLTKVGPFASKIAEVRSIVRELDQLAVRVPTSDNSVSRVQFLAERVVTLLGELHTDEIPNGVWVFLRAVGSPTGADLSLLSSEVASWL